MVCCTASNILLGQFIKTHHLLCVHGLACIDTRHKVVKLLPGFSSHGLSEFVSTGQSNTPRQMLCHVEGEN